MSKRRMWIRIGLSVLILILVLVMLYSGLQILESTVFYSEPEKEQYVSKTIVRGETAYYPRADITVILVMGIDQEGPVVASEYHRNPGASDMVALLILDQADAELIIPMNPH